MLHLVKQKTPICAIAQIGVEKLFNDNGCRADAARDKKMANKSVGYCQCANHCNKDNDCNGYYKFDDS